MDHLVLASASPRRKEILQKLNIPFTTFSPNADETLPSGLLPSEFVKTLALRKARLAFDHFPQAVIIGSDTIVVCNDIILGKPKNCEEAKYMLKQLSGQVHSVYTGVAIIYEDRMETFYEKTDVEFWELTEIEINQYIKSGEPFDKAGAYGIQGQGALLVKKIIGDYYTVVGLPISRLYRTLIEMGLSFLPK
ncbi:Maf family protein [Lederbergia wuyishanensis]|uniref:dTTP/UTP pyrophosphatase n=1 Tax=Lederbergia wuyishanensis TaxID=1347903 RepID=A0ABU0D1S7_9BACI|nr:Maf family protein [Lederbergia wuyishanensis]MCJ8006984.1 Maf family protein [Lederbergia wuyishanensis]MDQ0342368.1 septum formation protein [Lederbergia wuyishanensis]